METTEAVKKTRKTSRNTRLVREMQKAEGGGVSYIPASIMARIKPALNWVGRKVEYKRRPFMRHRSCEKVEYTCTGMVVDVDIQKNGVTLFVNCLDHEDHKEMWKKSHLVSLVADDGAQIQLVKPTDASLAFWNGGTGRT